MRVSDWNLPAINHAIGEHVFGGRVQYTNRGGTVGETYPLFSSDMGTALKEIWSSEESPSLRLSLLALRGLGLNMAQFTKDKKPCSFIP